MDTQSVHAVEYNDDLLIEILVRLPVVSLFLFKSVCKRWLSLISNPTFTLRRSQIPTLDPSYGLLIRCSCEYDFVSFDTRIPSKRTALNTTFPFCSEGRFVRILQSCNGLLLCWTAYKYYVDSPCIEYYVYNPCINLSKMIPQCLITTVYGTRIAFDPTKSPHYKVIQAVEVNDDGDDDNMFSIQIQTYSSETRKWNFCGDQYLENSFYDFDNGIYWNDAICWLNSKTKPLLFKLHIAKHQALTTVQPPVMGNSNCELFESCGCLLLLCMQHDNRLLMDLYEMRKGYSEWLVKYRVNLNDDVSCPRRPFVCPDVYSIVLGEREEDSFIVIEDSTKIFQYKPVLKTLHDLYDLKSAYNFHSFQFIASFAGVGL